MVNLALLIAWYQSLIITKLGQTSMMHDLKNRIPSILHIFLTEKKIE